ncbi:MliC family protein [Pseudoalteromonas sp. SSDWG2]|uniref:MliC family protein n=1 Tax=Pseudoalteromonas sp. SSDWG2 TaxID=3139391 RepID=UPI003BACB2C0
MKRVFVTTLLIAIAACQTIPESESMQPDLPDSLADSQCTQNSYLQLEQRISSQDNLGHGPDIGSVEWAISIEHRVGVAQNTDKPVLLSKQWCAYMNDKVAKMPSFHCNAVSNQVQKTICNNEQLAQLDKQLDVVYHAALKTVINNQEVITLKATQRGWAKGRDECWKAQNINHCVESSYQQRIDNLRLTYDLLKPYKQESYQCVGQTITVQYYDTSVPRVKVSDGMNVWLMQQIQSEVGKKYTGRNESLWVQDEHSAVMQWKYNGPRIKCALL